MIRIKYKSFQVEFGSNNEIYNFVNSLFLGNSFDYSELIDKALKIHQKVNELLLMESSRLSKSLVQTKVEYNGSMIELDRMNENHREAFFLIKLVELLNKCVEEEGSVFVERD